MIWILMAFPGGSFLLISTLKYDWVINKNVWKPEDRQWSKSTLTSLSSRLPNISTFHFYNKNAAEPFNLSHHLFLENDLSEDINTLA